jgi:hypothetical protein
MTLGGAGRLHCRCGPGDRGDQRRRQKNPEHCKIAAGDCD